MLSDQLTNQPSIDRAAKLLLTPSPAGVDEEVQIQVTGLPAGQRMTIQAEQQDDVGRSWRAQAQFQADANGIVDLATQPALAGSYTGVDGMGLFWSMTLDPAATEISAFKKTGLTPTATIFTVEIAGQKVTLAPLQRLFLAPNVVRTPVRVNGLAGTFFTPRESGPYPAVVVFGGSGGGLSEVNAALLAAHGYATLALAYFAYEELPPSLVNIPLEYFERAFAWVAAQPSVLPGQLAVMGASRGGELALLLGATFPQIGVVIANVPSHVIWEGVGRGVPSGAPAWSYRGVSLPVMQEALDPDEVNAIVQHKPVATTPLYLLSLADQVAVAAAAIPVEQSRAAILLISGEDDQLWPSAVMAERVMERLRQHQYPYPYQHLRYPDAGHLIGPPFLPATTTYGGHPLIGETYAYGGKPTGIAFAMRDAWQQILQMLATMGRENHA